MRKRLQWSMQLTACLSPHASHTHTTAQTCTHPILFHTDILREAETRTQCDFTPIVHFSKTAKGVYVPALNLFRFFGKQTQDSSTLTSKSLVAFVNRKRERDITTVHSSYNKCDLFCERSTTLSAIIGKLLQCEMRKTFKDVL